MKKTIVRVLAALSAFTAGLIFSHVIGAFTDVKSPAVAEVKPVAAVQLAIPPPPPTIPVPVESPKQTQILDFDVKKFSPEGTYEISGKAPKGFDDFSYIAIFPQETSPVSFGLLKSVEDYEYSDQDAVFALVTQKRLVLVTGTFENGFEYRFDGQFLRNKNLMDYPEGTVVLQGTLTKSFKGKTVAEANVKLHMVWDAC